MITDCYDYRLHTFVWHGTDPSNKTRKIPGGLKFTKLRVIPDQFYLNIDDVSSYVSILVKAHLNVYIPKHISQALQCYSTSVRHSSAIAHQSGTPVL